MSVDISLALGSEVSSIGRLIGLIDDGEIKASWFSDPPRELADIPKRVPQLLTTLEAVFGPANQEAPTLADSDNHLTYQWYGIKNPLNDTDTHLYVVAPPAKSGAEGSQVDTTSATIGIGLFHPFRIANLTFTVYAILPLFHLTEGADPSLSLGSQATRIGLTVAMTGGGFQPTGQTPFASMVVEGDVAFSDGFTPSLQLQFCDEHGNPIDNAVYKSFQEIATHKDTIIANLGEIITQGAYWLYYYVGSSDHTIGDVLSKAGLLQREEEETKGVTYHFDAGVITAIGEDLEGFAKNAVFAILQALADSEKPLVPFMNGGLWVANEETSYGFRVMIPDVNLSTADPEEPRPNQPELHVALGSWFPGETDDNGWINKLTGGAYKPGVSVFLADYQEDTKTITFNPSFELNSIGFRVTGHNDAPAFNVNGYTLKSAEMRAYLNQKENWQWGVGAQLDGLGIPLGGSFDAAAGGAHTNPVAKNLLASGDGTGGNAASGQTDAVNPTFALEAAYINRNAQGKPDFLIQLQNADGSKTDRLWFPVQRQVGPLSCQKLGVQVDTSSQDNPRLALIFDGGVKVGPLEVDLIDLLVGIPLGHPGQFEDYQVDLEGMSLSFKTSTVEISGGFLKNRSITDDHPILTYDGDATLKFQQYSLSAFGSYGVMADGQASLFLFAMLMGPIGGPGFFYVTGIAAGFGYNRGLHVPSEPKDVSTFPLISLLPRPQAAITAAPVVDPGQALQALSRYIPPQRGAYWLAVGVQFTSFKIVTGNLLLIVKFGNEFEIDVLGLAQLQQPCEGPTYVSAELGLVAALKPAQGIFMVKAALTDNSYILDPQCHLTGGFAFVIWFAPHAHAGDFVLTLGGYHPAFPVPAHYPQVDRLGINWALSDRLTIRGEAYFALTPAAAMLGGRLDVAFHSGNLRAWATAHADMIIFWKPFYLEASVGIAIGVSYRLDWEFIHITLEVSLSVALEVWGPPTGGTVHIDWYIISFTIGFGAEKHIDTAPTVGWEAFQSMLPQTQAATPPAPRDSVLRSTTMVITAPSAATEVAVLSINAGTEGVRATAEGRWLIRPYFSFTVQSTMPVNSISLNGAEQARGASSLGVRPMGITQLATAMGITITRDAGASAATWSAEPMERPLPPALWGPPISRDVLLQGAEKPLKCLVGLSHIHLVVQSPLVGTDEFDTKTVFDFLRLELADYTPQEHTAPGKGTKKAYYRQFLGLDPAAVAPTTSAARVVPTDAALKTINDASVSENRQQLFAALVALGIHAGSNGSLPYLAENPIGDLLGVPLQSMSA